MRSAPTLKIWITPFSSVAMLEKLALLKIALCNAPVVSSASARPISVASAFFSAILRRTTVGVRRRSRFLFFGGVIGISRVSKRGGSRAPTHRFSHVGRGMRPDAQRLERVLRDESAVLTHDHDGRNRRSLGAVPLHRSLDVDPGVFAYGPLTVLTAGAASGATTLQSGNDPVLVVRGDSLVVVHGVLN